MLAVRAVLAANLGRVYIFDRGMGCFLIVRQFGIVHAPPVPNLLRELPALCLWRIVDHFSRFIVSTARVRNRRRYVGTKRFCSGIVLPRPHALASLRHFLAEYRVMGLARPTQIRPLAVRFVAIDVIRNNEPPRAALKANLRTFRTAARRVCPVPLCPV